ncbi:protein phosphatase 1 regulatory subunit 12B-like isoform X2 [Brachyhypopomus gauderio]|uniref:protein phosphatase 1 regulatory subunit 12B-like isoform X2 n=1 Tax=Brachyhypopomus gauderio TaxID=698409 RepID=UPI0040424B7D
MSSLYSRNKDLSSRTRKSVLDSPPSSPSPSSKSLRHDRISRSDSSGVECSDRPNKTSYTRRDRLASLNKTDDDSTSTSYKKLYEDALAENEKLKARLEDSKQELTKIRSQLDSVTQKQDRISEKPSVLESEKREKQALEKKVAHMEEEIKKPAAVRFRCGYQP